MRQAIVTKYHGATNTRGSRISARAQAGKRFYICDSSLGTNENHDATAAAFAIELGWIKSAAELIGGGMPDGTSNVYVIKEG